MLFHYLCDQDINVLIEEFLELPELREGLNRTVSAENRLQIFQ